ncbi:MAG: pentapeptide repeat-containing protein [Rickettsiales bacterium]|nr:pentapeptide repeat-containing protein [Rickettsiales bacterium]
MAIEIIIDRYVGDGHTEPQRFMAKSETMRDAIIESVDSAKYDESGFSDVNLSGKDLSGENLQGIAFDAPDFSNAILRGTNFKDATFTCMHFQNADLRDADFGYVKQRWGAYFQDADLRGINWEGSQIFKAEFFGAKMDENGIKYALTTNGRLFKNPFKNLAARLNYHITRQVSQKLKNQFCNGSAGR